MSPSVLIVGYGRFGQALATLLAESGMSVHAIDPFTDVPESLQPAQGDPFGGVRHVFLCVPVWAFHDALASVRDRLGPQHILVDVSSVRSGPERSMRELLGAEVPWVGTHPLFGPSSVALGERPLRVVVTLNELHPGAVAEVAELYERLGCVVRRETAEEHDRRMAYSHALAFFVAKAVMDIGVPTDVEFVPPSFRAFARTVDSVRSDAGHLFLSIQNLNPYAAGARDELLARLAQLHDELGGVDPELVDDALRPALAIPDLGARAPELKETRELIDEVDRDLVRVIARRMQLARRAGRIKNEHGSGVRDLKREEEVLEQRRHWARTEGLDPDGLVRVFEAVMAIARRVQERG